MNIIGIPTLQLPAWVKCMGGPDFLPPVRACGECGPRHLTRLGPVWSLYYVDAVDPQLRLMGAS